MGRIVVFDQRTKEKLPQIVGAVAEFSLASPLSTHWNTLARFLKLTAKLYS